MADAEDRELFDLDKANEGIKAACDAFDALGLTLLERHQAIKSLFFTYSAALGIKSIEFVDSQIAAAEEAEQERA